MNKKIVLLVVGVVIILLLIIIWVYQLNKKVSKCEFMDRSGCDISCISDSDCKSSLGSCVNVNEDVYLAPNTSPMYGIVECKCENKKCVGTLTGETAI